MTAKILYLPPRTPMARLIHDAGGTVARIAMSCLSSGLRSTPSEHYNAVCDGTFTSVLGLDHQQLVDEAMAEKAKTSPPLH